GDGGALLPTATAGRATGPSRVRGGGGGARNRRKGSLPPILAPDSPARQRLPHAVPGSAAQPAPCPELSRAQVPPRHRPHVARALAQLADDGGLEPGVHEAVLAARVLARLPVAPVDAAPEL